ncbi:SPOR domain-containing protein [Hydrogenovibrio kuenenii]|uniref:SPOR domain-containing protein n=1 Tax=Hydrogenovibrio kuenenii TaxID=63658 RepID=UPI000466EE8E|nr:SPOR domain-containing protein [Hydrogenovibrio kuenenii]
MEANTQDLSLKFRMTGALVWLLLLIIIVPVWYSHPVNFSPDLVVDEAKKQGDQVVVDKPFVLPGAKNSAQGSNDEGDNKLENKTSEPQKVAESKTQVQTSTKKSKVIQNTVPSSQSHTDGKWIIRVAAYRSKEKANLLREHLKYDYDVFVKYFPKSRYYSVRIGPYTDKRLAMKDQVDLNRVLRIHSVLAKTN